MAEAVIKVNRCYSTQKASGCPAGGQTFEKFDKQVLSRPYQAPPK